MIIFSNLNLSCSGKINKGFDFEFGDETNAAYGCGATLQNVFWYFGGYPFIRQVKL